MCTGCVPDLWDRSVICVLGLLLGTGDANLSHTSLSPLVSHGLEKCTYMETLTSALHCGKGAAVGEAAS